MARRAASVIRSDRLPRRSGFLRNSPPIITGASCVAPSQGGVARHPSGAFGSQHDWAAGGSVLPEIPFTRCHVLLGRNGAGKLATPLVCLAAHDSKFRRWTPGNVKLLLPPGRAGELLFWLGQHPDAPAGLHRWVRALCATRPCNPAYRDGHWHSARKKRKAS